MTETLSALANFAQIATAVVACWAYFAYRSKLRSKRLRLEKYLEEERSRVFLKGTDDTGKRSVTHLMARVAMTEADILEAAFSSDVIEPHIGTDKDTGQANRLLFSYEPSRIQRYAEPRGA
jgi:hypothetical protein